MNYPKSLYMPQKVNLENQNLLIQEATVDECDLSCLSGNPIHSNNIQKATRLSEPHIIHVTTAQRTISPKSDSSDLMGHSKPLPNPIIGVSCSPLKQVEEMSRVTRKVTRLIPNITLTDKVTVTCGPLTGELHLDRFICPGLHHECIALADGLWVTPKTFSVMGGKASLKNWKNAVRVNNISIRYYLDCGHLDFYKHDELCSGKCNKKPTGNSVKQTIKTFEFSNGCLDKEESSSDEGAVEDPSRISPMAGSPLKNNPRPTTDAMTSKSGPMVEATISHMHSDIWSRVTKGKKFAGVISGPFNTLTSSPSEGSFVCDNSGQVFQLPANYHIVPALSPTMCSAIEDFSSNGVVSVPADNHSPPPHSPPIVPDVETMMEDSLGFWHGISELGLLEDIITEMKKCLNSLQSEINKDGLSESAANALSNIVIQLQMTTKIKYKLSSQKQEMDEQDRQIQDNIDSLKHMMHLEQQKQLILKRKSQQLNNFLLKRPRQRDAAHGESSTSSLHTQHVPVETSAAHGSKPKASAESQYAIKQEIPE